MSEPLKPPRPKRTTGMGAVPYVPEKAGTFWWSHDLVTLVVVGVLLLGGWAAHAALTRPGLDTLDLQGLTVQTPNTWLPTQTVGATPQDLPATIFYQSTDDPRLRLEIRIDRKPTFPGPVGPVLDLYRGQTYGDLYKIGEAGPKQLGEREWHRTTFSYAYLPAADGAPAISHGIEYALVNGDRLYAVTVHGPSDEVLELEDDILSWVVLK